MLFNYLHSMLFVDKHNGSWNRGTRYAKPMCVCVCVLNTPGYVSHYPYGNKNKNLHEVASIRSVWTLKQRDKLTQHRS